MLGTVFLPWKEKFGNGSPPGSAIFSSVFLSTSKFGNSFRPEYVGGDLVAVVLPWDRIFGCNFSPAPGGGASLTDVSSSGCSRGDLSLSSGSGSTTGGAVSVSAVAGTIGLGSGITISGALMLKTVSAGTSSVNGSVTMGTADLFSGSSGVMILSLGSEVSITEGFITVSVGSGDNCVVLLEEPEGEALVEEGFLEERG